VAKRALRGHDVEYKEGEVKRTGGVSASIKAGITRQMYRRVNGSGRGGSRQVRELGCGVEGPKRDKPKKRRGMDLHKKKKARPKRERQIASY